MAEPTVIERLADKLAAADLDDEEAALLLELLSGSSEVEGFMRKAPTPVSEARAGDDDVFDRTRSKSWIDVLSTDWGLKLPDTGR